jgi:hypothetical protein
MHFSKLITGDNNSARNRACTAIAPASDKICTMTAKTRAILAASIYLDYYVIGLLYTMTGGEYRNLPLLPGRYV